MALFDFDSAAQGAAAGSVAGPWGAVIGAVAGGLIGGRKKKKHKQAYKKRQAEIAAAMSAKRRAELTQSLLPLYRGLVASGPGAAKQQDVGTALARHGYTGTGVGETMRAASGRLPDIEALRLATADAGDMQRNRIIALGGPAFEPYPYEPLSSYSAADLGTMAYTVGSMRKPKGPPVDHRDTLFPGGYA